MKLKRTLSFLLALVLILLGTATAFATNGTAVLSVSSADSTVELLASFNGFKGEEMSSADGELYYLSADLDAGCYLFKIRSGEVQYGHPGTVKDTTAFVWSKGIALSDSINAGCTLIATGGTYTFIFNAQTGRLQIIKDGLTPEENSDTSLTVKAASSSVVAQVGDTVNYSVFIKADKAFEDIQSILGYDDEKLQLIRITSQQSGVTDNEAEAKAYCPNISDVIYNSEYSGAVAANASSVQGYDFSRETLFLTLDFKVLTGGEALLDFTLQEMTATDSQPYYTFSVQKNTGVTVKEALTLSENLSKPEKPLAFSGAALTLHDNLSINFKANESLFTQTGYENPYVVFELNGSEYTVTDYTASGGKYIFDFSDIAPNNMNDTVTATLYADFDGVEYKSEAKEYSVATYCYNMLAKYSTEEYAKLRTLLVDLLNYGAGSQLYTDHNTQSLVNANLTESQQLWATAQTPVYKTVQNLEYKTVDNPTVQWKGGGLNLVDAVTMRFKLSAESYEGLSVRVETDDRVWEIPREDFAETAGGCYVYFSGLNAGEMSESVYLTVYRGEEAVSNTLCYSIESYAYAKQNSQDASLTALLAAMMKYGNSAYAYAKG